MDPTLAVVACCALGPIGLALIFLLGKTGKDGDPSKLTTGAPRQKRSWPSPWPRR